MTATASGTATAGQYENIATVTATVSGGGPVSDSDISHYLGLTLDYIVISPDTATITAGDSQVYTAEAFNSSGSSLGDVTSSTTFSIETGAGGSWDDNEYDSEYVGTWTVTGEYDGLTDTAILMVTVGSLDYIIISPDTATITAGDSQVYTAEAFDAFDNSLGNITSSTTFSIETGAGGSWDDNIYISENVGTWTVTGEYDGLTDTAILNVVLEPEVLYFTVDFLGKITRVLMDTNGRILEPMIAPNKDGMHLFEMDIGTRALNLLGNPVSIIEIRYPPDVQVEPGIVIIENLLVRTPVFVDVTFDGFVTFTIGYDVGSLPQGASNIEMSYLDVTDVVAGPVWIELDTESDIVAGIGELSAPIEESGIYAILADVVPPLPPPAEFRVANLDITRLFEDTWEIFTFVKKAGEEVIISATVTNFGGQSGVYEAILKLNGQFMQSVDIALESGNSSQITFTISGNEPGDYIVEIRGLSGTFTSAVWINWWLIAGLIAALLLVIWSIWYYGYHKRRIRVEA
jgi:hypothetical protein